MASDGATELVGSRPLLIAEIGTSHQGDIGHARELIDAAAESGADCVKTQIVYADELVHPRTGLVELPGGSVPLWERFRALQADRSLFEEMNRRCRERGVSFLASCFGERSLQEVRALQLPSVKIASPELNHLPLLRAVREAGLHVFLSGGVSTLSDIDEALRYLSPGRTTLMHCVTAYPAPPEEYNLRLIRTLSGVFGIPVGVSDHSLDPLIVPTIAAALGATCIEKHFTLAKSGGGLDDPIALEPEGFRKMVASVNDVASESAGASGTDEGLWSALRRRFGATEMEAVLGDGVKRLAPSERSNYGRTNRSILSVADIAPGETLTEQNVAILRSEKNLTPGLHPRYWELVLGAQVIREIGDGEGLRWDHLLR